MTDASETRAATEAELRQRAVSLLSTSLTLFQGAAYFARAYTQAAGAGIAKNPHRSDALMAQIARSAEELQRQLASAEQLVSDLGEDPGVAGRTVPQILAQSEQLAEVSIRLISAARSRAQLLHM